MKLTIFHDGQFFVGLIEYRLQQKSIFAKYTFGSEPDSETIFKFINQHLLKLISTSKVSTKTKKAKNKINPKKLQRKVAKEQQKYPITTQSQRALKKEQELKKKLSKKRKRKIKVIKAKEKHKGH